MNQMTGILSLRFTAILSLDSIERKREKSIIQTKTRVIYSRCFPTNNQVFLKHPLALLRELSNSSTRISYSTIVHSN